MRWLAAALVAMMVAASAWRGGWPLFAIGAAALGGFVLGLRVGAEIERGRP